MGRQDMGTSDFLKPMQELEAVGLAVSPDTTLYSTLFGTLTISLVSDSGKGIGHPLPSSCQMRLHVSPQAQVAKRQYFAHSVTFFYRTSFLISW